jgi:tripartite-type tricarboxylate transporter receptor subunit TctC
MMEPSRRRLLHLAGAAAVLPAIPRFAHAQAYPSRPVRIIVGAPAGGGIDMTARLTGQWLSERLNQQFVVENRAGAGGNIAAEAVIRSPADGMTLALATPANAINATLYERLNFDFMRDIAPVGAVMSVPLVVVVNPSLGVKSIPEFIAYTKAHPGKVNVALGGTGGVDHMAAELLKMTARLNMTLVPYRGLSLALPDLLSGHVQVVFSSIPAAIEYIRTGKLQPLAVTSTRRAEALPELPTLHEFVPGVEASQWYGVVAPKDTPAEIIRTLNMTINAGLADTKIKARLGQMGGTALPGSPAEFGQLIAADTEKWGKVIRAAHIKPV